MRKAAAPGAGHNRRLRYLMSRKAANRPARLAELAA